MLNIFKKKLTPKEEMVPFPSSLVSSTHDYGMNPRQLQHEMKRIAERNDLFVTTRKAVDDFQRNVFSNISEGQMDIKISVVCRPGGPATMSFQLFIGYDEKLMEENVEYPLNMSNVRRDMDMMITHLMTKVLATLAYTAMYKVIEKVDTL